MHNLEGRFLLLQFHAKIRDGTWATSHQWSSQIVTILSSVAYQSQGAGSSLPWEKAEKDVLPIVNLKTIQPAFNQPVFKIIEFLWFFVTLSLMVKNFPICIFVWNHKNSISQYIAETVICIYFFGIRSTAAAKSLQSFPTLCDPIDSSHQAPPSLGFSRQEHWSGLPFPSPMHRDFQMSPQVEKFEI